MRRAMRWIGFLGLALLVLVVGVFAVSRLMGPTDAQRAALALLEADDPKPTGRNAFASLWLIEYDVPEAEREALVQVDAERYRQALTELEVHEGLPMFSRASDKGFEKIPNRLDGPPYCGARDADCLSTVRVQREAYVQRIAWERDLLERVRALSAYDHSRSPMPLDHRMPVPPVQRISILRTASALDFIEGRTDEALAGLCQDADTWRRLGSNTDSLILSMIGVSVIDNHARLLMDMLAELPLDHPLPAACGRAFDPQRITPDLCPAMRGEANWTFAIMKTDSLEKRSPSARLLRPILMDIEATRARMAPTYAHGCTDGVRRALVDDTPIPPAPGPGSPWRLDCASNFMGCTLASIGAPAYMDYLARAQDAQAMLRTVDTILRLREQMATNGKTMAQAVREDGLRPAVDTWRTPTFDEATGEIGIPLRGDSSRTEWRIPLPGSRLDEAPAPY